MKIIITPFQGDNDYLRLFVSAVRLSGHEAVAESTDISSADAFLCNWYENTGGNAAVLFRKLRKLTVYRDMGLKIIWVMHNKRPHMENDLYGNFMMQYLAEVSDCIIVLCEESINCLEQLMISKKSAAMVLEKVWKIPHVNYIPLLNEINPVRKNSRLRFLFFGRLRAYKCLDILMEAFDGILHKEDMELYIVGPSGSDRELQILLQQAKRVGNVTINAKYVTLPDLCNIVKNIDIFVIPLDLSSCLNSGSVMMAFSLMRSVICPNIGMLKEYGDVSSFAYTYEYQSRNEHVEQLMEKMDEVYQDWKKNGDILQDKGRLAWEKVKAKNSMGVVSKAIGQMLMNL